MKRNRPATSVYIVILAALVAVVFFREIFGGSAFAGGDLLFQNFPRMSFIKDSLSQGDVPLWAPYAYSGYPFAAEPQSGVFYPPNLLLLLFPIGSCPAAMLIFHYFAAGFFMFLLCRSLGLSHRAALAGALVYGINGFTLIHSQHCNMLYTMAWVPLLLALAESLLKNKSRAWTAHGILMGATAAVMLLAGHLQLALYGLLAVLFFGIFRMKAHSAPVSRTIGAAVTTLAVLISLFAVQFLQTREFLAYCWRSGRLDYEVFASGALAPKMLISFLFPHFWGSPWDATFWAGGVPNEIYAFIGALPLALAAVSMWNKRLRPVVIPFAVMAFVSIIWALGDSLPLTRIIYHVPFLNWFRIPARALFFFVLGGSVLAAAGMDYFFGETVGKVAAGRPAAIIGACAALGACAAIGLIIAHGGVADIIVDKLAPVSEGVHPIEFYRSKSHILLRLLERDIIVAAAALGILAFGLRRKASPASRNIFAWACIALIVADFTGIAGNFIERTDRSVLAHTPDTAADIRGAGGFGRLFSEINSSYFDAVTPPDLIRRTPVGYRKIMEKLNYELPLLYRLESINGYGPLNLWDFQMLTRHKKYVGLHEDKNKYLSFADVLMKGSAALDVHEDRAVLDMLKVRFAIVQPDENSARLEIIDLKPPDEDISPFWVEYPGYRYSPPARVGLDPASAEARSECGADMPRFERRASGIIRARVTMCRPGTLVLMEKYFPGWQVFKIGENGRRQQRLESFERSVGIGVRLEAGSHELEYVFAPKTGRTGLAIGLVSLLACLVTLLASRRFGTGKA